MIERSCVCDTVEIYIYLRGDEERRASNVRPRRLRYSSINSEPSKGASPVFSGCVSFSHQSCIGNDTDTYACSLFLGSDYFHIL